MPCVLIINLYYTSKINKYNSFINSFIHSPYIDTSVQFDNNATLYLTNPPAPLYYLTDPPALPHYLTDPRPPHYLTDPRPPHNLTDPRPPHYLTDPPPFCRSGSHYVRYRGPH